MKIVTVVGARPQFVKAATISRVIKKTTGIQEILVHTGQHYDFAMSDLFFDELDIPKPDINLGIGSSSHGSQTGRMLEQVEKVLLDTNPDLLLVYGDTNSTLAAALAAVKLHIPVAHVEAGLRNYDLTMPEEVNRLLTDVVSKYLFVPTQEAVLKLQNEGISDDRIFQVGDVMFDAALFFAEKASKQSKILENLSLKNERYILGTIHRPVNTDDQANLTNIFDTFEQLSKDYRIVLPLHPRTRLALERYGKFEHYSNKLNIIEPVGYLDMTMLEKNACLIVTDSGGVQKEAFFHKVPCVNIYENTCWVDTIELGWNRNIEANDKNLYEKILSAIGTTGKDVNPYGDGHSAERIIEILCGKQRYVTNKQ